MKRYTETYDSLFEKHPTPMWIVANEGFTILDINRAAITLLQQDREELLTYTLDQLFRETAPVLKPLLVSGKSENFLTLGILKYKAPSGETISLRAHYKQTMFNQEDCWLVVANEIVPAGNTDKNYNGEKSQSGKNHQLIKQQELLNVIINSLPGVFYLFDENGKFLLWNKNFETVTGYSGEEVGEMIPLDFFEGSDRELIFERISKVFTEGKSDAQADFCTKSKAKIPYQFNGCRIDYEGKRCLIGMGIDITLQKEIETENHRQQEFLERTARRLELATKSAGLGVFQIDFINDTWEIDEQVRQIFGIEDTVMTSELYWSLMHPDEREAKISRDVVRLASTDRQYRDEYKIIRPCDKEVRFIRTQGVFLRDENGKPTGGLSVIYDQTKEKVAEQGLVQSISEKETLIKEVHHRIKNNLQLISSIVYLKLTSFKDRDIREFLEGLREKIKSISILHERLLQTEKLDTVSMNDYLVKVLKDIQVSFFRQDLLLETKADVAPIHFESDAATYCGLIINELVTNAIKHAFPNRDRGKVMVRLWKEGDGRFVLSVSDNGIGLPDKIAPHENSTFGMSLVYIFVKQLRGDCTIVREAGTDFQIRFTLK